MREPMRVRDCYEILCHGCRLFIMLRYPSGIWGACSLSQGLQAGHGAPAAPHSQAPSIPHGRSG